MVDGFSITYKPKDANSRTLFHHTVFGRIIYRNYRGRKYAYYAPGILDSKRFARLLNSKIFVLDLNGIDVDLLNIFGEITIEPCAREESQLNLKTGREYWTAVSVEKNLLMRDKLTTRKKKDERND